MSSTIDYRLAKHAVVRQLVSGELTPAQVCDAHPELLRAATFIGSPTPRVCPVCKITPPKGGRSDQLGAQRVPRVVELTWLYGDALRQKNGHIVEDSADLSAFERHYPSFSAWTVECCTTCGWNHLISRRLCGFSHFPGGRMATRSGPAQVSANA